MSSASNFWTNRDIRFDAFQRLGDRRRLVNSDCNIVATLKRTKSIAQAEIQPSAARDSRLSAGVTDRLPNRAIQVRQPVRQRREQCAECFVELTNRATSLLVLSNCHSGRAQDLWFPNQFGPTACAAPLQTSIPNF